MSYLGWVANVFVLIGMWRLGTKARGAFLWTVAGEALWVIYGFYLGMLDIALICILFGLMAAINWWRWRPEANHVTPQKPCCTCEGRAKEAGGPMPILSGTVSARSTPPDRWAGWW